MIDKKQNKKKEKSTRAKNQWLHLGHNTNAIGLDTLEYPPYLAHVCLSLPIHHYLLTP